MESDRQTAVTDDRIAGVSITVAELVGVRGLLTGRRNTPARRHSGQPGAVTGARLLGRGMEYAETRAYLPGDDTRTMDWRVMARTGEAHSKVFTEEKERRLLLVVDLSASMFFGTRVAFKSWAAARLAAHLGWQACIAGDRIGGLIGGPGGQAEIRPGRTRKSLLAIFHQLAAAGRGPLPPVDNRPRLNDLLRELRRLARSGCNVALISDFLGLDGESDELLRDICAHNRVTAWWIHDASEVDPWPGGFYPLLVDGRRQAISINPGDGWLAERQQRHREGLETLALARGFELRRISCNQDITRQLVALSR